MSGGPTGRVVLLGAVVLAGSCASDDAELTRSDDAGDASVTDLGDDLEADARVDSTAGDTSDRDSEADDVSPDVVVDTDTCPAGQHDGGDGECVPIGSCSPSFVLGAEGQCVLAEVCSPPAVLLFADNDGDGVGAGDPIGCGTPGEGLSAVDGDCDDGDAAVFVWVVGWKDLDGDGYHGTSQTQCTNGEILGDWEASRAPLWFVSWQAATFSSEGPAWKPGHNDRYWYDDSKLRCESEQDQAPCSEVTLSNLGFRLPIDAEVTGIEVIVDRARRDGAYERLVQLVGPNGLLSDNLADDQLWNNGVRRIGAADQNWGHDWTVEDINSPEFGVRFDFEPERDDRGFWVEIRELEIIVHVAEGTDCDDGEERDFLTVRGHLDQDDDDHAGTILTTHCLRPDDRPEGVHFHVTDCDDTDRETHPFQERFEDEQRLSGGFDYNCDGIEEMDVVNDRTNCRANGTDTGCLSNTSPLDEVAPCGEPNEVRTCRWTGSRCVSGTGTSDTKCR